MTTATTSHCAGRFLDEWTRRENGSTGAAAGGAGAALGHPYLVGFERGVGGLLPYRRRGDLGDVQPLGRQLDGRDGLLVGPARVDLGPGQPVHLALAPLLGRVGLAPAEDRAEFLDGQLTTPVRGQRGPVDVAFPGLFQR